VENLAQQQNQQGQQSQQQGYSGQGMQFSDSDLMNLALNETKNTAHALNIYISEANSNQLRQDYMTVLGDVYSEQKQLFDMMQQKGYYKVQNADQQDISQAQSKFSQSN
jgi:spore coat protein CotF